MVIACVNASKTDSGVHYHSARIMLCVITRQAASFTEECCLILLCILRNRYMATERHNVNPVLQNLPGFAFEARRVFILNHRNSRD